MQRAHDAAEFLRDPIGRCAFGPNYVVWCHSPELCGSAHWGVPSEADALATAELLDFVRHPEIAPAYDVLLDTRLVERVDGEALLRFGEAIKDRLPEWAARIRRQVVILPANLAGVMLAGLVTSLDSSFPVRFVAALDDAFAHLDGSQVREAIAEIDAMIAQHRSRPQVIDRVRAQIERDPALASLPSVARALGAATRSLQRELQLAGSSFSDELRRVRVGAAVQLLLQSDSKVEVIAQRIGFGTASRMSAAFRRELGVTPTQVRSRR